MSMLQEQVTLITGAGTGIGSAIALAFIDHGARVALAGRRLDKLREVASGFPTEQVLCCACDVSDRAAVNSMNDQVRSQFGEVTILVNNAGINSQRRTVGNVDPETWDQTIAINLTGAFNCTRAVLPGMRNRGLRAHHQHHLNCLQTNNPVSRRRLLCL